MGAPSDRRGFLRGLVTLPLIGGGVTLIGSPTGAAEPITDRLLDAYDTWLQTERRCLVVERYGPGSKWERLNREGPYALGIRDRRTGQTWNYTDLTTEAAHFHFRSGEKEPQPSTRAAIVLSAVGCGWKPT